MIDAVGAGGSLPTREEPALVSIACHGHGYGRLFAMTTTKHMYCFYSSYYKFEYNHDVICLHSISKYTMIDR